MRISDWSSDVCSSDLRPSRTTTTASATGGASGLTRVAPTMASGSAPVVVAAFDAPVAPDAATARNIVMVARIMRSSSVSSQPGGKVLRSEEHTSELQSLMRISYAVFCLKKKKKKKHNNNNKHIKINRNNTIVPHCQEN